MNNNPLKTVVISKEFNFSESKSFVLEERIASVYADVTYGHWQIAIKDITCIASPQLTKPYFVQVSSNFVTGQRYSENLGVQHCYIPLLRFQLSEKLPFQSFTPLWFNVNEAASSVKLYLTFLPDWSTSFFAEIHSINITVTILLRRFD